MVLPKVPEPKVQGAPKLPSLEVGDAKPKAMSSLLGAYSDSEDEEEEQMKVGRLSTAAAAVVATAGANKARAEVLKPQAPKASQAKTSQELRPGTEKPVPPVATPRVRLAVTTGVAPAPAAPVPSVASRAAAARHDGLARERKMMPPREVLQERIDMRCIDGEELTPEELAQVAHKCGSNAWRWRVREWRPAPRGQPLGSDPATAPSVTGSIGTTSCEEDPDFEDFAFFAGLTEGARSLGPEACELDEVPQAPATQSTSSKRAPLAFRHDEEEERLHREEQLRLEKERQEEEEREWRRKQEERRRREEEEAREKEKKRREDAIRLAEEERERRARRRRLEEEEKKRSEQERIEMVKKRAEEIERRRQAEEEFLANAEAQKKAAKAPIELKAPSSLPVPEGSLSALLRVGSAPAAEPAAPVEEPRSRSPRRKQQVAKEPVEEHPKEMPSNVGSAEDHVGWMPPNHPCSVCQKQVAVSGGIFCGRRRSDGSLKGCGAAVCWRCMNRSSKDADFGQVRTNKAEFESLGEDAWWMHEACMEDEDLQDYYDGDEGKFAWE